MELSSHLRLTVEHNGDVVAGAFTDDRDMATHRRGRHAGWRALLDRLEDADEVIVGCAGDLPGRSTKDLLTLLRRFRADGVGLRLHQEGIDTVGGPPGAILDVLDAYRRAKLSQAIKAGQTKSAAAGKRSGRPIVPPAVRRRILMALETGRGIRPTARRFKVSPATVINIRYSAAVGLDLKTA